MTERGNGKGRKRERESKRGETESVYSVDDEDDDNRSPGSDFNDVLGHSRRIPPPQLHQVATASKLRASPYLPLSLSYSPLVLVDLQSRLALVYARKRTRERLEFRFTDTIILNSVHSATSC